MAQSLLILCKVTKFRQASQTEDQPYSDASPYGDISCLNRQVLL